MSPPVADKNIDWSSLGLGLELPNRGHVEARFHLSTGKWTDPELIANPNISISGMSPGLNYGQQCYEGLKAFRTADGHISVFRPAFHAARLQRSAEAVSLPAPSQALFLAAVERAVAANAHLVPPADTDAYLYIRPVLFGASAQLALAAPEESVLAVYVHPIRPYHGTAALDGLVLEDFDRAAPRGVGGVKVGGNYAPVWRHAARAKELGYGITMHLDSATRTFVEEFSTSGFLGHRTDASGRSVLVVPQTENAIASATSDSMVRVAEREGWIIEKKELPFSSLSDLDEVVAVGTAAAAVPIRTISRLSTNEKFTFNSAGGELLRLSSIISGIQRGTQEDSEQWGHPITKF